MRPAISRDSFYKYLKCTSWIAHDIERGSKEDALRLRLQQDGLLPEVEREVVWARGGVVQIAPEDAERGTLAAMERGEQTIYRPRLVRDHLLAEPDLLERVQGKSKFGDYYYVACDVKRSRHIREEYKMQGCFYSEVLGDIQGTRPVMGYIMRPHGEIESYLLDDVAVRYRLVLDAIARIFEGERETHFLTSDCKQSPWFHLCKEEAITSRGLSCLNRLWRSEAAALEEAGFFTIDDLARAHPDGLASKVASMSRERLHFLQVQAQAIVEKRAIILRPVDLPTESFYLVVDVESNPLRNYHYLIGALEVDGERSTYHSFLARTPAEEKEMWEEFSAFAKKYVSVPLYHYGAFEHDVFEELQKKYETDPADLIALLEESIDLLPRFRESVVFPLSFYSLKDIAQYIGFRWRHDDASGLNSVLWHEAWMTQNDDTALKDILEYNEDDVQATAKMIEWARKQK